MLHPVELWTRCTACREERRRCMVLVCEDCGRHFAACEDCGGARQVHRALAGHAQRDVEDRAIFREVDFLAAEHRIDSRAQP